MRGYVIRAVTLALSLAAAPSQAQDIPLRELITIDSNLNVHVRKYPGSGIPRHSVILLAGGNGVLGLNQAGDITELEGNFLIRSAGVFHQDGLNIAMLDAAPAFPAPNGLTNQRLTQGHADFLGGVIAIVRNKWPGRPVWLIGTSNSTLSVVNAAARLTGAALPDGIVLTSAVTKSDPSGEMGTVLTANPGLASITIPTVVIWHQGDTCSVSPAASAMSVFDRLVGVQPGKKFSKTVFGGRPNAAASPCSAFGAHGYNGAEREVVEFIRQFIVQATPN